MASFASDAGPPGETDAEFLARMESEEAIAFAAAVADWRADKASGGGGARIVESGGGFTGGLEGEGGEGGEAKGECSDGAVQHHPIQPQQPQQAVVLVAAGVHHSVVASGVARFASSDGPGQGQGQGQVWTFGKGANGRLGLGDAGGGADSLADATIPRALPPLAARIVAVAAGRMHTVLLDEVGGCVCVHVCVCGRVRVCEEWIGARVCVRACHVRVHL